MLSRLIEYIQTSWNPIAAGQHADSLDRAIAGIERLVKNHATPPQ